MKKICLALLLVSATAWADDVTGAAKAFSQAQEAMLAGDAARAAEMYELADDLSPSAPALRNAARARLQAGHEAMAATNAAELLQRYSNDKESREVAEAILGQLSAKLVALDVTCSEACTVALEGNATATKPKVHHVFYAKPGARTVVASFGDKRQAQKQITAIAGKTVQISLDAPAKQPEPEAKPAPAMVSSRPEPQRPVASDPPATHGLGKTWLFVGIGATVALGAITTYEGLNVLDTRDQINSATAMGDMAKAQSLYNSGRDQQLATNILIGATAAAGVTTIVLAAFTNWSGSAEKHEMAVVPTTGGATFVLGGQF